MIVSHLARLPWGKKEEWKKLMQQSKNFHSDMTGISNNTILLEESITLEGKEFSNNILPYSFVPYSMTVPKTFELCKSNKLDRNSVLAYGPTIHISGEGSSIAFLYDLEFAWNLCCKICFLEKVLLKISFLLFPSTIFRTDFCYSSLFRLILSEYDYNIDNGGKLRESREVLPMASEYHGNWQSLFVTKMFKCPAIFTGPSLK